MQSKVVALARVKRVGVLGLSVGGTSASHLTRHVVLLSTRFKPCGARLAAMRLASKPAPAC